MGDDLDGLFFGYNGTSFGVMRRQNGVDQWIPQSDWNFDKLDGLGFSNMNLDPTKGNIYSINFQWLGFGCITFGVAYDRTGEIIPVHRIQYPNSSADPHIFSPNLPLMAEVKNAANATDIRLETAGAMVFLEGRWDLASVTHNSVAGMKSSLADNVETGVLSIRNKTSIGGKTNRVTVKLQCSSCSSIGNLPVQFRLLRDVALTGAVYSDIHPTNSVVQYNTAGTYSPGTGTNVLTYQLLNEDAKTLDLVDMEILLLPGETWTLTANSGKSSTIRASLTWMEFY